MNVLGWLIIGFVAGGLARMATDARKRGCLGTIAIGILGALLGGALFRVATGHELDAGGRLDLGSLLIAFVGSVALLLILEAVDRSPRSRHR